MKFDTRLLLAGILVSSMATSLTGCGDDGAECGGGTVLVDGTCVPADSVCAEGTTFNMETRTCEPDEVIPGLECGEGTIEMGGECVAELDCGTGTTQVGTECVPDGSILCTGNTVFDEATGTCVVDPEACAEGTVYLMETGECVPFDDTLMADVRELAEPNDPQFNEAAMAQMADLPASGPVTLGGCIEPRDFDEDGLVDVDLDFFTITVEGPTLLDVSADGVGGLSGGVAFVSTDPDLSGWIRSTVDQSSDNATGQVYLPKAGEYQLLVSDSRSLVPILINAFYGRSNDILPAGGPDACYFIQVARADIPAATALTAGTPATGVLGDPQFYSFSADEGLIGIDFATVDADGEDASFLQAAASFVVRDGTSFRGVGPALLAAEDGTEFLFVVDTGYLLSSMPIDFRLTVEPATSDEYPEDGTVSITHTTDDPDVTDLAFFTFQGEAGDIAHLNFDSAGFPVGAFAALLLTPTGELVDICPVGCVDYDEYIRLVSTGSYAVGFFNFEATVGTPYSIDLTRSHQTPAALTLGTAAAGDLMDDEVTFFTLDARTADWLTFTISMLMDTTDLEFTFFDIIPAEGESEGYILGGDIPNAGFSSTDSSFDRVYLGEGSRFLIGVTDADTVDGTESFSLLVEAAMFTDLGTVTSAAALTSDDVALAADGIGRFVFRGTEVGGTDTVTVTGDGTLDVVLSTVGVDGSAIDTSDDTGAGGAETLTQQVNIDATAFTVTGDAAGTFDVSITEMLPPYAVAPSAITFSSICPSNGGSGTQIVDADDGFAPEQMLAMGGAFPFTYFGEMQSVFTANSNGWLSFTPGQEEFDFSYNADPTLPLAVAPLWTDLIAEVCVLRDADTFTVEWNGETWTFGGTGGDVAQVQAIFHTSGVIDFVYGADHEAALGGGDFAGIVDADGNSVAATAVVPGASITFTPR